MVEKRGKGLSAGEEVEEFQLSAKRWLRGGVVVVVVVSSVQEVTPEQIPVRTEPPLASKEGALRKEHGGGVAGGKLLG